MTSPATRRLGRVPSRHDPRTLQFASYAGKARAHAPPPARDWGGKLPADVGLYGNDHLGDCTCVATAHLMRTWRSQHGDDSAPPVDAIVQAYSAVGGYVAGDESTDNGAQMLDVLRYWRATGIAGRKIAAYVRLDADDVGELQTAINLFGGIYVGAQLPLRAQTDAPLWAIPMSPDGNDRVGSWGGHAMACVGYDRSGVELLTWGHRQRATWAWATTYLDEAWCVLDDEWVNRAAAAPNGFDLAALASDLEALRRDVS